MVSSVDRFCHEQLIFQELKNDPGILIPTFPISTIFVRYHCKINQIMKTKVVVLIIAAMTLPLLMLQAQEPNDTIPKKKQREKPALLTPYHRNVIKFNPTPMLLFGEIRNITISYERLIKKNQSVALQVGYLLFPRLISDTILHVLSLTGREKYGINLAFDYRYYPSSRNRRPAPDGLYIGGYLSYYGFHFRNNFDILNTAVDQNGSIYGRLNVINLGISIGYQFIFWKRFSVDLLMFGPALSSYTGFLQISGDLDEEEIKNLNEEMVDKLLNRFPALGEIFSDENLKISGTKTKISAGFRYSIQLGFHF